MTDLTFRRPDPGELLDLQGQSLERGAAFPDRAALDAACRTGVGACWKGRLVAAGGVLLVPGWAGRGIAWLMIDGSAPCRIWPAVLAETVRYLAAVQAAGTRRIEAQVATDFPAGLRLAARLGFAVEGLARAYFPDGCDAILYARVAP